MQRCHVVVVVALQDDVPVELRSLLCESGNAFVESIMTNSSSEASSETHATSYGKAKRKTVLSKFKVG